MWNTPSPPALWGSLTQAYCFVPEEAPRSHSVGPLPPTLILPCGPTRTSTQALRTQCSQSGCHTPMPIYMALISSCGEHQKLPGSGKSKPVPWVLPSRPPPTICNRVFSASQVYDARFASMWYTFVRHAPSCVFISLRWALWCNSELQTRFQPSGRSWLRKQL